MNIQLKLFEVLRTLASIIISIAVVAVILAAVSAQPGAALSSFLIGPFSNFSRFGNVVEMMIPLTFTGLAVCVIFKANQFNLITEGSFYSAAVTAAAVAIYVPLPPVLLPMFAILAGMFTGGALAAVPAIIKVKTGSNILVVSLMLNYIAALLGRYVSTNVFRDPASGSGSSYRFQIIARMPNIVPGTRIHFGFIIMIVSVALVALLVYRTKLGYSIRMVGLNERFAAYSGIHVNRTIILSQIIGGVFAGIGGTVEMLGMYNRFSWVGTPGFGWDAIIISILANGNPLLIPVAAFFLSSIRIGADTMNMTSDVPAEMVAIVQAVMILLLVSKKFLSTIRSRIVHKAAIKSSTQEVAE